MDRFEDASAVELADLGIETAFTCSTGTRCVIQKVDDAKEAAGYLDLVALAAWHIFGPAAWRRVRTSAPDLADLGDPVVFTCSCPTVCTCGTVIRLKKHTTIPPTPAETASMVANFVRAWIVLVPRKVA